MINFQGISQDENKLKTFKKKSYHSDYGHESNIPSSVALKLVLRLNL